MAEAARAETTPLHHGLHEEIVTWEILVRLSPKSLLRCRSVCRSWRCVTTTCDFLLAHHARQPTLPFLYNTDGESLGIIPFDHRAGLQQPIARFSPAFFRLEASCDGLLVLSALGILYYICNPATRQYAHMPMLCCFTFLGMYRHRPTNEYRIMYAGKGAFYVFVLGSGQPPRQIGLPPDVWSLIRPHILFSGL
ncbi:hypothetical protein VPH35_062960 [Triticum aestivum]